MQFDDIKQQASIDLARFIAPNHFHFREHTPAAYKEIAEPLLQQRLGLTNRELYAVKALALWASFEEIERAAFASLVRNISEPPKTIPEHDLMRINALRHNVCLAAYDYARWVGDPLLIEAWPKPVWMAETQPEAESAKPIQRAEAQDTTIRRAIKQAGHNPLFLPRNKAGKPGVKAAIRKSLKDNSLFIGATVFDRAWERLRKSGDLADSD